MLSVSEAVTLGALERKESRGGHTRDDYPFTDDRFGKVNVVIRRNDGQLSRGAGAAARDARRAQDAPPGEEVMAATEVTMRVWRGDASGGAFADYHVAVEEGMVVLDVIHRIQATQAPDLAVPLELQGRQVRLVQRRDQRQAAAHVHDAHGHFTPGETITVAPMKTFPIYRDLVTDVVFNYEKAKTSPAPSSRGRRSRTARGACIRRTSSAARSSSKCIECFLCQDVCHVIRDHPENKPAFAGPRFFMRLAALEMHPLDTHDRMELIKDKAGLGFCNITKCCTEVCPEHIHITDNAIIPLKERVVTEFHDPWCGCGGSSRGSTSRREDSRVPGQGDPAAVRCAGAEGRGRGDAGGGARRRRAPRRPGGGEGAGARGGTRQGGWGQGGG